MQNKFQNFAANVTRRQFPALKDVVTRSEGELGAAVSDVDEEEVFHAAMPVFPFGFSGHQSRGC
jgi:hypothetical protein